MIVIDIIKLKGLIGHYGNINVFICSVAVQGQIHKEP